MTRSEERSLRSQKSIFDILHRFKPALQDGVVEKILSLVVCSLRGFKDCHSGKHSRLLSHHIRIHECCECGYPVFLSEDGRTGRTDTNYKPVQVCVLKEEKNIGRALSARLHLSCFSSKIYAWLLRALSSDRVIYIYIYIYIWRVPWQIGRVQDSMFPISLKF